VREFAVLHGPCLREIRALVVIREWVIPDSEKSRQDAGDENGGNPEIIAL
jgi:hypothetical protein